MKAKQFRFYAVSDKVLKGGKVRYLLFFEADEPYQKVRAYRDVPCPFRVFPTRNGFHVIGSYLTDAKDKALWFQCWKNLYPNTDYRLQNLNWLAPHSVEEWEYIKYLSEGSEQLECDFYRDKSVFETLRV